MRMLIVGYCSSVSSERRLCDHEAARDKARTIAQTPAYVIQRREQKKVEMLFAYLKRILRLDRLRLRGPNGAKDELLLEAAVQNLRKLTKLVATEVVQP